MKITRLSRSAFCIATRWVLPTVASRKRMKLNPGQIVVLTGASGGLGTYMVKAFARRKVHLALVAYPGKGLEELAMEAEQQGVKAVTYPYDLRDSAQRHRLLEEVHQALGPVDVLVNNAGVEFTLPYHELTEKQIGEVIDVNLVAPMILSRLMLPQMLERGHGHIVNISSLAGKSGPACQEPYAATKAALVAFTSSLRATYRSRGVSASAVVPGFVEAGIYSQLKARSGCSAPALLGTSPPGKVAQGVLHVIERDLPEIIINPLPVRPLLALTALFPRFGEWLTGKTGANEFFLKVVEAQKNESHS